MGTVGAVERLPRGPCVSGSRIENTIPPVLCTVKRASVSVQFGKKLRQLRERAGLSQSDFAQAIGLSRRSKGYISEIEAGKKTPPVATIVRIASHFGVTIDYLLRDDIPAQE